MAQLNTLDCETGNASIEIQALKLRESYLALIPFLSEARKK